MRWWVVVFVLVTAAACSSSSSPVVRTGGPPPTQPSSQTTTPSSSPATRPSSSIARHPTLRVVPSRGLRDHQQVQVRASGFTPYESLQVIECAAKGTATGPGDCNLTAMQSVAADAAGRVTTTFTVLRGPFGANRVTCDSKPGCLISVTQASLNPTEEADTAISFGGRPAH